MKTSRLLAAGLVSAVGFSTAATAATLYQDQMNSGAGWAVNASGIDSAATFGYDYSADDIPEAPKQPGG